MCGIAVGLTATPIAMESIQKSLRLLGLRGPDGAGTHATRFGTGHATFAHTRLSIIDLDERSNQPFVSDGCVLVFNGEIYNYLELRQRLSRCGHNFITHSDTEVITKSYLEWGERCVEQFEGMWAFILLDKRQDKLLVSRDRFGEKPLYWAEDRDGLYFASEVKALSAISGKNFSVDIKQVRRFLVNGYKSLYKGRSTFFEGVTEVLAGSIVILSKPSMTEEKKYWAINYRPQAISAVDAVEGVRQRLCDALRLRMRADVPVAFCLSGGVDSTALVSIATKELQRDVYSFSIIDEDSRYNESDNIDLTLKSLGIKNKKIKLNHEKFLSNLKDLVSYHDAPVATISYYIHSLLSRSVSEHGYKVAISGTGADELFTGYYDHYGFWLAEHAGNSDLDMLIKDWRNGYGRVVRNPYLMNPETFINNPNERRHIYLNRDQLNSYLSEPLDEDFTEVSYTDNTLRNRMLNELLHESVPLILHEDDRNSMRWSVENRSPFLDSDLATFAYEIPNNHLVREGYLKWILREAIRPFAPEKVAFDKRKRGFNASINTLLDRKNPTIRDWLLSPSPIYDLVDRSSIETLIDSDLSKNSESKFMFSFISSKLFLESRLA